MRTLWRSLAATVPLVWLAACATPAPPPPTAAPAAVPAPAPAVAIPALLNPGFESLVPGRRGDPEGWFTFQHAGDKSYEFALDTVNPHSGLRSMRIRNIGPEPYGAIAQSVTLTPAMAGKVARFSAWMRTDDAATAEGAVLTVTTLQGSAIVTHDFMGNRPVKGTTGWTRYTIDLAVPRGAERVEVGAMLHGKGTLWMDDATLELVTP